MAKLTREEFFAKTKKAEELYEAFVKKHGRAPFKYSLNDHEFVNLYGSQLEPMWLGLYEYQMPSYPSKGNKDRNNARKSLQKAWAVYEEVISKLKHGPYFDRSELRSAVQDIGAQEVPYYWWGISRYNWMRFQLRELGLPDSVKWLMAAESFPNRTCDFGIGNGYPAYNSLYLDGIWEEYKVQKRVKA